MSGFHQENISQLEDDGLQQDIHTVTALLSMILICFSSCKQAFSKFYSQHYYYMCLKGINLHLF